MRTYKGNQNNQNPDFDTEKYFEVIELITREIKRKKISYIRIFSEPRNKTGYRTKYWGMEEENLPKIEKIINKLYPNIFKAIYKETTELSHNSIVIAPINKEYFYKS